MNNNTLDRLAAYFKAEVEVESANHGQYSEADFKEISGLLKYLNPKWSIAPRTYTLTRLIDCINILDELLNAGFNDLWFPVTDSLLPPFLDQSLRLRFVEAQRLVLTASGDVRCGEGQHFSVERGALPFEHRGHLNSGAYGTVDRVVDSLNGREYARKRIPRRKFFSRATSEVRQFASETHILKHLSHRHVVSLISTYTDPDFYALLLEPVADGNLSDFIWNAETGLYHHPARTNLLRGFFGCLSAGLTYMHKQKIRHKDIKPANILIKGMTVLYTDFGISVDWTRQTKCTTEGPTALTPRYAAPEVADYGPRNASSDIWSLGCVFLEILSALKGRKKTDLDMNFMDEGTDRVLYSKNARAMRRWLVSLELEPSAVEDNIALTWIRMMLQHNPSLRSTSQQLTSYITQICDRSRSNVMYCNPCCLPVELDPHVSTSDPRLNPKSPLDIAPTREAKRSISEVSGSMSRLASSFSVVQFDHGVSPGSRGEEREFSDNGEPPGRLRKINRRERLALHLPMSNDFSESQTPSTADAGNNVVQLSNESSVESLGDIDITAKHDNGNTILHIEAQEGHMGKVTALLKKGYDVHSRNYSRQTPLHMAVNNFYGTTEHKDQIQTIKGLLKYDADISAVDIHDRTPMHLAAIWAWTEGPNVVKFLLEQGAALNPKTFDGTIPLHEAVCDNSTFNFLLDKRADIHAVSKDVGTPLCAFAGFDIRQQIGDSEDMTDSYDRYCAERLTTVRRLLHDGADVNGRGGKFGSPIIAAVIAHCRPMGDRLVDLLIKSGADWKAEVGPLGNAFQAACYSGSIGVIRRFLREGGDVNAYGGKYGYPLQAAAARGILGAVRLLHRRGAQITAWGGENGTALHAACAYDKADVVRFLVVNGADLKEEDGEGRTPLQLAVQKKAVRSIGILIENGADPSEIELNEVDKDVGIPKEVQDAILIALKSVKYT